MGDPYRKQDDRRQPQKPQPQTRQWKDMTPEERKAWCKYFQGKGPRPSAGKKGTMTWDE